MDICVYVCVCVCGVLYDICILYVHARAYVMCSVCVRARAHDVLPLLCQVIATRELSILLLPSSLFFPLYNCSIETTTLNPF